MSGNKIYLLTLYSAERLDTYETFSFYIFMSY